MEPVELLLTRLMNFLADRFKGKLILKGGMLFRLLGSPRETIDLDYAWIRTQKRDQFGKEIKEALEKSAQVKIESISPNSRGIFLNGIDLNSKNKFKIEINVVKKLNLPPETRNTAPLADKYSLEGRMIATMALPENFSHKIAAAIERGLARDFFDITQTEGVTDFDPLTLKERFAKLQIDHKPAIKVSAKQGAGLLRSRMESLSEAQIQQELSDWLKPERLVGLGETMRMAINRVCRRIEAMES